MPEKSPSKNKPFSIDWLLRGTLTKLGDIFDRLTGRGWKPSSSLATSQLIDRLNLLLDREAKDVGAKGKFVPHNIKLKMQWDKFSIDSDEALKKLESELLIAAVDHINDNRYHTYAPLKLEIKPDYFTEGVKLQVSFGSFVEEDSEADLNVTVPDLKNIVIPLPEGVKIEPGREIYVAEFTVKNKSREVKLELVQGQHLSVGRSGENGLTIDDNSVSKVHASLALSKENQLVVADTGSTNGTFINDRRIAYGKAFPIGEGDKLMFGVIDVSLRHVPQEIERQVEIKDEPIADIPVFRSPENFPAKTENTESGEDISDAETVLDDQSPVTKSDHSLDGNQREDNIQPTEQGIRLDLGENK